MNSATFRHAELSVIFNRLSHRPKTGEFQTMCHHFQKVEGVVSVATQQDLLGPSKVTVTFDASVLPHVMLRRMAESLRTCGMQGCDEDMCSRTAT
jgi:hypothetical protein